MSARERYLEPSVSMVRGYFSYDRAFIKSDTAGEYAGIARNPGFRLPGEAILPRVRLPVR